MPRAGPDLELTHYSGASIALNLVTLYDEHGSPERRSLRSALSAAVADAPLADWLEPYVQETWIGGCGGGGPTRGYAQAPGLVTRIGDSEQGFVFPGPAEFSTTIPPTYTSPSPIAAIEEFGGNLFFLQVGTGGANEGRVFMTPGGGAAMGDTLGGASGYSLPAGNTLSDLLVFTDPSTNTPKLWASGNDASGARLHGTADGGIWDRGASGIFAAAAGRAVRFDWLAKVFWVTENGDRAWRMVAGDAAARKISYTRPGGDPMLPASWVLDAVTVDSVGPIRKPPAIRRHLYLPGQDNIFDLDELGNTPGIVSDMDRHRHPLNGHACFYLDEYVYFSYQTTLGRVYVGDPGQIQTTTGVCGPGAFTPAEHEFSGWATCFTGDQSHLVAATFNATNGKAGIWWGRDRKFYPEIETANPMLWWGPEIHSTRNLWVTAMRTHTRLADQQLHIWVASVPYAPSAPDFVGGVPRLSYFTLPTAGQPLSDYLTRGGVRFAVGVTGADWQPVSTLASLPYSWRDKASRKFANDITIGSRGLDVVGSGTNLELYTRADPEPGATGFGPGAQIGTSPTQRVVPATATAGNKTQYLIKFISPHGADPDPLTRAVGVLDAVRMTAFRRAPAIRVLDAVLEFGTGIRDTDGAEDQGRTATETRALLRDLTEGDRTTMRVRPGRRYTVIVRQVMDERDEFTAADLDERAQVRLQIGVLADLGVE